jgi:hypothetical protein
MLYSERGGRVTKLIQPDEIVFMINAEADPKYNEFTLAVSV